MIEAIVIGVSAGGLKALSAILPELPPDFRIPVAVVQHLQDDPRSELASILDRACRVGVKEAEGHEPLEGGTVYIAPPGYHLLVERGRTFSLSADPPVNFARPSIDVLFESAAEVFEERLAGIILTGANHDGAAGLAAVKRAGGLIIVQDPASAEAPVMPGAAIRAAPPDHILSLSGIAAFMCALDQT